MYIATSGCSFSRQTPFWPILLCLVEVCAAIVNVLRRPGAQAPCYRVVKVIGARGDKGSLSDADTDARMALAAYRR